jgi:hypothetical protein
MPTIIGPISMAMPVTNDPLGLPLGKAVAPGIASTVPKPDAPCSLVFFVSSRTALREAFAAGCGCPVLG